MSLVVFVVRAAQWFSSLVVTGSMRLDEGLEDLRDFSLEREVVA